MDPLFESHSYPSYSQAGEDRIIYYILERIGRLERLRYVDVGASAPAGHNNTYLFYTLGGSGVLVEADPMYVPAYRELRPRDVVESVAVVPMRLWVNGPVTFRRMSDRGWSSVSEEHVQVAQRLGKGSVECQMITVPSCTINEILYKHFPDGIFDLLSLDVEGLDREILMELDLERFRPRIVVVENPANPMASDAKVVELPGYKLFASTFVNSIYVARDAYAAFIP